MVFLVCKWLRQPSDTLGQLEMAKWMEIIEDRQRKIEEGQRRIEEGQRLIEVGLRRRDAKVQFWTDARTEN